MTGWRKFTTFVSNKLCGTDVAKVRKAEEDRETLMPKIMMDSRMAAKQSFKKKNQQDSDRLTKMKEEHELEIKD